MTGAALALGSAACYGVADVAGGLLARRADFRAVAFLGQAGGLGCALLAALLLPAPDVRPGDLAWGALSGAGTGAAMVFLYRGIARGAMSVVVPVSAVGGVALPVAAGVVLLGDRPSAPAWAGIAVVLPALWLVSRSRPDERGPARAALRDGLVASLGIGVQYLALAQAGDESGAWPVAAGRVAAVLVIAAPARRAGPPDARTALWAAANGTVAAAALVLYLEAAREQLTVVAVVLASLYPVVPVLAGVGWLRERLSAAQGAGLAGAAAAVVLLTLP
ncbi:EamA family transporter [Actinomadura rifamycini]|uniref:EamA family transporter n=1 Tax=Actinomadura rifamycini TaxID=31962 RepID=UPI0004019412|nr:EamA family transporter [Actinomadura rifamycini]